MSRIFKVIALGDVAVVVIEADVVEADVVDPRPTTGRTVRGYRSASGAFAARRQGNHHDRWQDRVTFLRCAVVLHHVGKRHVPSA